MNSATSGNRWYLHRAGQTGGPYDEPTIIAWIRSGMVDAVIRAETADSASPWTPLSAHPPFALALAPPPTPAVSKSAARHSSAYIVGTLVAAALVVGAVWFLLSVVMGDRHAGTSLAGLVRAPVDVKNEVVSVGALTTRGVPMSLPYAGELQLEVNVLKGKHVNVYVIDASDWHEFEQAQAKLFGGKFHHYPQFHAAEATQVRRSGRLGAGARYVVIENPTFGILVDSSFDVEVKARLEP